MKLFINQISYTPVRIPRQSKQVGSSKKLFNSILVRNTRQDRDKSEESILPAFGAYFSGPLQGPPGAKLAKLMGSLAKTNRSRGESLREEDPQPPPQFFPGWAHNLGDRPLGASSSKNHIHVDPAASWFIVFTWAGVAFSFRSQFLHNTANRQKVSLKAAPRGWYVKY